jgi:hypothetical protein
MKLTIQYLGGLLVVLGAHGVYAKHMNADYSTKATPSNYSNQNLPKITVRNATGKKIDKVSVKFKFIGENNIDTHDYHEKGFAKGTVTVRDIPVDEIAVLDALEAKKSRVTHTVPSHFSTINDMVVMHVHVKIDGELHSAERIFNNGTHEHTFIVSCKDSNNKRFNQYVIQTEQEHMGKPIKKPYTNEVKHIKKTKKSYMKRNHPHHHVEKTHIEVEKEVTH